MSRLHDSQHIWLWSKLNHQGTAGFSPCFHLPGFHFERLFVTHSTFRPKHAPKAIRNPHGAVLIELLALEFSHLLLDLRHRSFPPPLEQLVLLVLLEHHLIMAKEEHTWRTQAANACHRPFHGLGMLGHACAGKQAGIDQK